MYALDYLKSRSIGFETLLHRPSSGATKRAQSIHVTGRQVAKTVLVRSGEAFVLAVLPATSRIDLNRLAAALGGRPEELRLATPEEIDRIFQDCEPGAIPPFGRLYGLKTVVDAELRPGTTIVLPTNTRHIDLRLPYESFEDAERPLQAAFGQPIASRSSRSPSQRRRAS